MSKASIERARKLSESHSPVPDLMVPRDTNPGDRPEPIAPQIGGDVHHETDPQLQTTVCPVCGASRRVQKVHCAIHDVLYDAGGQCDHCAAGTGEPTRAEHTAANAERDAEERLSQERRNAIDAERARGNAVEADRLERAEQERLNQRAAALNPGAIADTERLRRERLANEVDTNKRPMTAMELFNAENEARDAGNLDEAERLAALRIEAENAER